MHVKQCRERALELLVRAIGGGWCGAVRARARVCACVWVCGGAVAQSKHIHTR